MSAQPLHSILPSISSGVDAVWRLQQQDRRPSLPESAPFPIPRAPKQRRRSKVVGAHACLRTISRTLRQSWSRFSAPSPSSTSLRLRPAVSLALRQFRLCMHASHRDGRNPPWIQSPWAARTIAPVRRESPNCLTSRSLRQGRSLFPAPRSCTARTARGAETQIVTRTRALNASVIWIAVEHGPCASDWQARRAACSDRIPRRRPSSLPLNIAQGAVQLLLVWIECCRQKGS